MDDLISRQAAIDVLAAMQGRCTSKAALIQNSQIWQQIKDLPSVQPEREDYTEMKREFLRMASYIDSLLVCSDEQKETLMNFISRIADDMPWTERD